MRGEATLPGIYVIKSLASTQEVSDEKKEPKIPEGKSYRQWMCAVIATLTLFTMGTILGWTSPTIPKFDQDPDAPTLDEAQISWVVSLVYLGGLFSPLATGYIMDHYGRKAALIVTTVESLLSWIIILSTKSVVGIYFARFLGGTVGGSAFTVVPIYICEIATPKLRGSLNSITLIMAWWGVLFEYAVGPYVSYTMLNTLSGIVPLVILLLTFIIPESPYYYVMINQPNKAAISLAWLRCTSNVGAEMVAIEETVRNSMKCTSTAGIGQEVIADTMKFQENGTSKEGICTEMVKIEEPDMKCQKNDISTKNIGLKIVTTAETDINCHNNDTSTKKTGPEMVTVAETLIKCPKSNIRDLLRTPANRKAFLMTSVLVIVTRSSGISVIIAYAAQSVPDSGLILTKDECAMLICSTWIVVGLLATALIAQFDRKPMMVVSCLGCSFSAFIYGLYHFLEEHSNLDLTNFTWVPLAFILLHSAFFSVGLGCVPNMIQGELFASNIKGVASGITCIIIAITSFLTNKLYYPVAAMMGIYVNYWFYTVSCIFGAWFSYYVLLETRNKTLQEIQIELTVEKPDKLTPSTKHAENV